MKKKTAHKRQEQAMTTKSDCKSPFLGATRAISFGDSTQHYVHCGVLSKYENLNACSDIWGRCITLKDVPDSVGCVLIHYLYSGTLEHQDGLETSLQVYCVARKYSIDGLAQLARQQVEQVVGESPALKILEIAQRVCKSFGEDDAWLDELVQVQSRRLLQVCQDAVQTLLLVTDRVSKILVQEMILCCSRTAAETPTESTVGDEGSMAHDYVAVDDCGIDMESSMTRNPSPDLRCVRDEECLSGKEQSPESLHSGEASRLDIVDLSEPTLTKKDKKKGKKGKKKPRDVECLEEVYHILRGNEDWANCDVCRVKVANLAVLYAEN